MWELIAEGPGYALANVIGYEDQIAEEQRARLSLILQNPLSLQSAADLQKQLIAAGVAEAQVITYGNNINIIYRKGVAWLAVIIPITIALLIVLAIVIIAWQFAKETPATFSLLMLGGIILGAGALIYLLKKT